MSNFTSAVILLTDAILFMCVLIVWASNVANGKRLDELADPKRREDDLV